MSDRGISDDEPGCQGMSKETLPITVYWRPGCASCERLRRGLGAAGVETDEINIWQDEQAANAVRMVANGNETVPTVTIGSTVMVDPPVKSVLDEIRRQDPTRTFPRDVRPGATSPTRREPLEVIQWFLIVLFILLSFLAEGSGRAALSWAIDGVNVLVYFVLKAIRNARATPTPE